MKYFSFANVSIPVQWVTHILNLLTVCVKMTLSSIPTLPVPFKMPNFCRKSMFITSGIKLVLNFNEAFLSLAQVHQ